MKNYFIMIFVLITNFVFPQCEKDLLNSLIAAEYQFSEFTQNFGVRDGFLKFIADDGILFRPNPVNGIEFLKNQKTSDGVLSWFPIVAGVSNFGDLGFTSGPWEFKKTKNDSSTGFGNFCTVWELQPNSQWKFVIDFGNSNANPKVKLDSLKFNLSDNQPRPEFFTKAINEINELIDIELMINDATQKDGLIAGYKNFINENTRLLRKGISPIVGIEDIKNYSSQLNSKFIFIADSGKMSNSGDLGFTYGKINTNDKDTIRQSYYLRIWKKYNGKWFIEIEVADL